MGEAVQSASAHKSATPLEMGVSTPMEVQGEEEAMEPEAALDMNVPTTESDVATAVSSPTPTQILIYSMVVSSTPVPAIPTATNTTITNCNASLRNPAILLHALSQGPHLSPIAHTEPLSQSTMSALTRI